MDITVEKIEFHRNGIGGAGFHVVLFSIEIDLEPCRMIGVVFEESGHVAVLARDDVASGRVDHAWRGDCFEGDLRYAVLKGQVAEAGAHLLSYDVADIADYTGIPGRQVEMVLDRLRAEKECNPR